MNKRVRTLLLLGVLLVVVVGGAVGTWYVLRRGARQQGLFERAVLAERAERHEDAIVLLRQLLETDPDHVRGYGLLTRAMLLDGRIDELEEFTRAWVERTARPDVGWRVIADLMMRRGQFAEAERLARSRADRDPLLVQRVLLISRSVSDSPAQLLEAAEASRRIALMAEEPRERIRAHIQAAALYLDLARVVGEERATSLVRNAREQLAEARTRLRDQLQSRPHPDLEKLQAFTQLLSDDEKEQRTGLRTLELRLESTPDDSSIRAALARHHLRTGDVAAALEVSRGLEETPLDLLLTTLRRFVMYGRRAEAIEFVERVPEEVRPLLLDIKRVSLMLAGDEDEKRAAVQWIDAQKDRLSTDPMMAARIVDMLAASGEAEAAAQFLEHSRGLIEDVRLDALEAVLLARTGGEGDAERLQELADSLGSRELEEDQSTDVMQILARTRPEVMLRFLGKRIEAGGPDADRSRLIRVMMRTGLALRAEDANEAEEARERAIGDLRHLAGEGALEPRGYASAGRAALALGEPVLAGQMLGRAVVEAEPLSGVALIAFAEGAAARDESRMGAVADGLRTVADAHPPWTPLLELIIGSWELRGEEREALRARLETALEAQGPGLAPALQAGVALAAAERDLGVAETRARRLRQLRPGDPASRRILAAVLLMRGTWSEVVELYADPEPGSPQGAVHLIRALMELKRTEEATEAARTAVERWPGAELPYLALAAIHRTNDDERSATGTLLAAPQTRAVQLELARLLTGTGEFGTAEQIYRTLLGRNVADQDAWLGLQQVMTADERSPQFTEMATAMLDREEVQANASLCQHLFGLRGLSYDDQGRRKEALQDYEASIRLGNVAPVVLNNAAWLIVRIEPQRAQQAVKYVEEALSRGDWLPELRDTASHAYLAVEEYEKALEHNAEALRLLEASSLSGEPRQSKELSYRLQRVKILVAATRPEEARAELERMRALDPNAPQVREAEELVG